MRISNIARWLLAAVLLAGCTGANDRPTTATSVPIAIADAVTFVTVVPATAPVTEQASQVAAPNGGGVTNDEPGLPSAAVAAATTPAPVLAARFTDTPAPRVIAAPTATETAAAPVWSTDPHPLQIDVMRQQSYPGSEIIIEQTLEPGANYSRHVVSYLSDGYKIYALMTIPNGTKPATGWPAIVFNHGYIAPSEYRTTERYVAYVDAIARSGYIVFKSDYRGWGSSEGGDTIGGGYGLPSLTVDVLNAVASLQAYGDADPNRIGMWGHSLGGQLTLRAMVVSKDIKAGVMWGGVVAPYPDIIAQWDFMSRARDAARPTPRAQPANSAVSWMRSFSGWVQDFYAQYGTPDQNPDFWATISPNTYLADLSGPIQLHHSTTDETVPLAWSETLDEELKAIGNPSYEFYTYPRDNHNINANFGVAMQRTLAFFDKYVKGQ